jgi:hypothetical protein
MDSNSPRHEDDLSDVANRLSSWRPTTDGLDADALLFAAGVAVGRRDRGRVVALALCGLLAILAVSLGAWGLTERAERQSLASRLRERTPNTGANPGMNDGLVPEASYASSPDDYFHLYRRLELDPIDSLASTQSTKRPSFGESPPASKILTPRQRDRMLEQ